MLKNEIIEVSGTRWLVREAVSKEAALNEVSMARVTGSVGGKSSIDETLCGGGVVVLADVVQINSDGTERKPYTAAY